MKLNGGAIIVIGLLALSLVFGVSVFMMYISYTNRDAVLHSNVKAQEQVIEANFDKMFKVISQIAQVPSEASKQFREMYVPLIEGRYKGDNNTFMKWIQEQNPAFDWSLYSKLQTAIEANRQEFFYEQKKLVSLADQDRQLHTTFPGRIFVSGEPVTIKIISSTVTKEVIESGIEDDIELFK